MRRICWACANEAKYPKTSLPPRALCSKSQFNSCQAFGIFSGFLHHILGLLRLSDISASRVFHIASRLSDYDH